MKKVAYLFLGVLLIVASSCQEDLCEKGFFLFCENDTSTPPPGQFTKKNASGLPHGEGQVNFSIGNKGYVGAGDNCCGYYPGTKLFVEYDPIADSWKSIADLPGEGRNYAVGFGTPTKGYVGGGSTYTFTSDPDNPISVALGDFYEYDPQLNAWEKKADLPGGKGVYSGFGIGNKGYVLKEGKFWEYNPAHDTWTPKTDCPISSGLTFAIGFRGYVLNNEQLWEYNSLTNKWTAKADPPITGGIAFATSKKGYLLSSDSEQIWEYNPVNDMWFRKADPPEIREGRETGVNLYLDSGFAIGDKGYFGIYYRGTAESFYEFDPNK